jgi:hypothetical protein
LALTLSETEENQTLAARNVRFAGERRQGRHGSGGPSGVVSLWIEADGGSTYCSTSSSFDGGWKESGEPIIFRCTMRTDFV